MEAMTSSAALRDLADRYWEARLEASPLFATFLGDHRYDDRVDDLSEAGDADQRARWSDLLEAVRALDPSGFDETDRVTHRLLAQELVDNITGIDTRLAELASDQMQGVHAGLLTMAGNPVGTPASSDFFPSFNFNCSQLRFTSSSPATFTSP